MLLSGRKNESLQFSYPKTLPNLNIGKYMATKITPTKTPTIKIIKGSSSVEISLDFCCT